MIEELLHADCRLFAIRLYSHWNLPMSDQNPAEEIISIQTGTFEAFDQQYTVTTMLYGVSCCAPRASATAPVSRAVDLKL
ncbi:hypothetical protein ABIB57_004367 [Devosia sp. UYZn731]|uniref:hypothetical protein n=1 Tax=Devosia sp. UYZn731 TaxID=3156345 RepID=UPI003397D28E